MEPDRGDLILKFVNCAKPSDLQQQLKNYMPKTPNTDLLHDVIHTVSFFKDFSI